MRRWIATTAFFAAYASAGYTGAQSPAPATSAATAVLRQAAQTGTLAGLKWPRFPYYRDELTALYTRGGWQPIWSSNNRPNAAARYPTTAVLSPETSPESAYCRTTDSVAPSACAARITATAGPPPHA